jgi:hypothetical protein
MAVTILYSRDGNILSYGGKEIDVVCDVRNELNGRRILTEKPAYTEDEDGKENGEGGSRPYMPRRFPVGTWLVTGIHPKDPDTQPYLAPFFIATNARRQVNVWTVEDGHYGHETDELVWDYGYGLHCSTSRTSWGCGIIIHKYDLADLVAYIRSAMKRDTVELAVV